MASPRARPTALDVLDDGQLMTVLGFLDGKSLGRYGRVSKGTRQKTNDEVGAGLAAALWRELCGRFSFHQNGTRTRGRVRWSQVYARNVCVECGEPGTIFVNDRALAWPNARFGLCRPHLLHPERLFNIVRRPEIRGDSTLLSHTLFRINTVRRELGYAPTSAPKRRRRSRVQTSSSGRE